MTNNGNVLEQVDELVGKVKSSSTGTFSDTQKTKFYGELLAMIVDELHKLNESK